MSTTHRLTITNGLFGGRDYIYHREAVRLIKAGMAMPECILFDSVRGYTFTAIRMTFKAYDQSPATVPMVRRTRQADERAMHASDYACNSLPAIQREELYSGSRRDGTAGPTTSARFRTLRKTKQRKWVNAASKAVVIEEFVSWRETDGFPPKRFNPDLLPVPMFARAARA